MAETSDTAPPADRWQLERFVEAQDAGGTLDRALSELRRGRKTSHWMWFVFPQLAGLGYSAMSQRYALSGLDEARAYLEHPQLGARLHACLQALDTVAGRSASAVLGDVDARKLHSSLTLFHRADPADEAVIRLLDRYFDGRPDPATDALL